MINRLKAISISISIISLISFIPGMMVPGIHFEEVIAPVILFSLIANFIYIWLQNMNIKNLPEDISGTEMKIIETVINIIIHIMIIIILIVIPYPIGPTVFTMISMIFAVFIKDNY